MADDLQAAKVSTRLAACAVCASARSMRQASAAVCSCFALCWSCKPGQLVSPRPLQPLILLNPREARWLPFRIMLPKIEGLPLRSDKVYHRVFFFFFLQLLSQGDRAVTTVDLLPCFVYLSGFCSYSRIGKAWCIYVLILLFRWRAKIFPNHRKRTESPR